MCVDCLQTDRTPHEKGIVFVVGVLRSSGHGGGRRRLLLAACATTYYGKANAKEIRYVDAAGARWTLSEALFNGAVARCQIVTRYDDGTLTVANGSRTERLRLAIEGRSLDLPPNAFWGRIGDGKVEIDSSRSRYEPGN